MIPHGSLHVMDHVSHHPQEERPEAFHAVVDGFLRSLTAGHYAPLTPAPAPH
jgi:pimeloyl-ACP methyl ester carboxylesterase